MAQTYIDPVEVDNRLSELGLEEPPLTDVVRRGYVAFASCTPNDPPQYPGLHAWAIMVRGLREYLLPAWSRSNEKNYSLVVNAEGTVAIAVATGDEATGRRGVTPSTKGSKGPSTFEAVATNQTQLNLFEFPPFIPAETQTESDEKRMTWILLVHRAQGEVRCELSLPTSMGADGRVDGWQERIILGSIPTDPGLLAATPPTTQLPDINVDVKRRA